MSPTLFGAGVINSITSQWARKNKSPKKREMNIRRQRQQDPQPYTKTRYQENSAKVVHCWKRKEKKLPPAHSWKALKKCATVSDCFCSQQLSTVSPPHEPQALSESSPTLCFSKFRRRKFICSHAKSLLML